MKKFKLFIGCLLFAAAVCFGLSFYHIQTRDSWRDKSSPNFIPLKQFGDFSESRVYGTAALLAVAGGTAIFLAATFIEQLVRRE